MARNGDNSRDRRCLSLLAITLALASSQAFVVGGGGGNTALVARGGAISSGSALGSTSVAAGPKTYVETPIRVVANNEEFERAVEQGAEENKATWCRKCKYIGTRLKRLEEHFPSNLTDRVTVMSLDVNTVAKVPQQQKIKDLPTIKFYAQGREVGSYVATDRGEVFYRNFERRLVAAMAET